MDDMRGSWPSKDESEDTLQLSQTPSGAAHIMPTPDAVPTCDAATPAGAMLSLDAAPSQGTVTAEAGDVAPDGTGNVAPHGTSDVAPDGTGNVAPHGTSDVAPDGTGNVAPEFASYLLTVPSSAESGAASTLPSHAARLYSSSGIDDCIQWLCEPESLTDAVVLDRLRYAPLRDDSARQSLALHALEIYSSNFRITGNVAMRALQLFASSQVHQCDEARASRVLLAVLKRARADKFIDVLRATLHVYVDFSLLYVDGDTWVRTIDAIGRLLQDDDLFATNDNVVGKDDDLFATNDNVVGTDDDLFATNDNVVGKDDALCATNDYVGTDDVYTLAIAALDVLLDHRRPMYSICSLAGHRLFVKTMVAVLTTAHQKRPDSWWKIPAVQHAVLVAPMHLAEVFEAVCVLAQDARLCSSRDAGEWFTAAVVCILEQLALWTDEPFVDTLRNRPWLVQATGTTWEGNTWGLCVHKTIRRYNELVPHSPLPECAEANALKKLFDKELAEALAVAQRCASKADARHKRVWYTVVSACALGVACFILW
jgi:hypothetical protein